MSDFDDNSSPKRGREPRFRYEEGSAGAEPVWDKNLTDVLLGSTILVGITYLDACGAIEETDTFFGTVIAANDEGVAIQIEGGGEESVRWLPPYPQAYEFSDGKSYRLRDSGEIKEPDFISSWTIRQPTRN